MSRTPWAVGPELAALAQARVATQSGAVGDLAELDALVARHLGVTL
ncbi:MAG: hypothetical protein ACR2K2_06010 [Mycobacteriales bacterium]